MVKNKKGGFTIIELLMTISIIAILAHYIIPTAVDVKAAAHYAKALSEFSSVYKSFEQYKIDNGGNWPADTNRDIPPGLEAYLAPGIWPDAAWPGSVFDWDNWEDPDDSSKRILQISVRFCPIGEPDECKFPTNDWADDFDINSSVFFCIQGACRAHINRPIDHPGHCVNCD